MFGAKSTRAAAGSAVARGGRAWPRMNRRRKVMMDERPRLAASEIEEELFAELQKLTTLHDTQYVTIRPTAARRV